MDFIKTIYECQSRNSCRNMSAYLGISWNDECNKSTWICKTTNVNSGKFLEEFQFRKFSKDANFFQRSHVGHDSFPYVIKEF